MSNLPIFKSILSSPIKAYICEKKALGYKFQKGIAMLKRFDKFVYSWNLKDISLPKEVVEHWTKRTPNETISNQCHRISLLRGLAEYMDRLGYHAYIYPRSLVTVDRYSYVPYIFSEEEICSIFTTCDNYPQTKLSPHRHLVLPLILRMLYACGLRISEALNLTINDVDLNEGTLFIANTKFSKERLIPMPDSLVAMCSKYSRTVLADKSLEYPFYPSPHGGCYASSTIYWLFREILWQARISHSGKGPRLHDIRHTFAVHCLKKWVVEGRDLSNCLPYLSTYLGHEDMRGTQRYLRLTADLYPDITAKVEDACSWLIPEVTLNEAD